MIYAILVIGLVLDQFTKYITITKLKGVDSVVIIKDWLEFTYVENTGVAFGSFRGYKFLFIIISLVAFFGILVLESSCFIAFGKSPSRAKL